MSVERSGIASGDMGDGLAPLFQAGVEAGGDRRDMVVEPALRDEQEG